MKLKQLLDVIFQCGPLDYGTFQEYMLVGDKLKVAFDLIKECEEFKDVEELLLMPMPTMIHYKTKESVQAKTLLLRDEIIPELFVGKCAIYSITLSPEMYDPKKLYKPVKDGANFGPLRYDPEDFSPLQTITLTFNPKMDPNGEMISSNYHHGNNIRKQLHETLDKILDNPNDYRVKGERHILIRGEFGKNAEKFKEIK